MKEKNDYLAASFKVKLLEKEIELWKDEIKNMERRDKEIKSKLKPNRNCIAAMSHFGWAVDLGKD